MLSVDPIVRGRSFAIQQSLSQLARWLCPAFSCSRVTAISIHPTWPKKILIHPKSEGAKKAIASGSPRVIISPRTRCSNPNELLFFLLLFFGTLPFIVFRTRLEFHYLHSCMRCKLWWWWWWRWRWRWHKKANGVKAFCIPGRRL